MRHTRAWCGSLLRVGAIGCFLAVAMLWRGAPSRLAAAVPPPAGCVLDPARGAVQHVIYLQFDNVHLQRDDPNVPSDLEQMPHLLDFLEGQGVLLGNHHTPLIAHTATDFLTALTGLYPDRHGVPVGNSFRTFRTDGTSASAASFGYWTSPVSPDDPTYNMLTVPATNTPAPWVPFTRAGCNVGFVGMANTMLENTGGDITSVFGADSPQAAEAKRDAKLALGDYVGVAVHCAAGDALCGPGSGGVPDLLPDEPGGYAGYAALFGHTYVAPAISSNGPLTDLTGGAIVSPDNGAPGFPGFDALSPAVSLGYVAAMQEHGIPVTYAYIADAHDDHATGRPYGPGEAGYVAQLQRYDAAFAAFFDRLRGDGIDGSNTLFVVTADEGDHFTGGPPDAPCDGVTTPCSYSNIGEIAGNLTGLLATQAGISTPFQLHDDSAPAFYVTGDPAQDADAARGLERGVAALHAVDPLTGTDTPLTAALADRAELRLLHMVTADPLRTPTFVMFANPQFYLSTGPANCAKPCVRENPSAAWDHGTIAPEITTTWLGLAGPGVQRLGRNDAVWSDHADIRPTMLALLGLRDDYPSDGRALIEVLDDRAAPPTVCGERDAFTALASAYKQIDAPLGALSLATLSVSTAALASNSPNDAAFAAFEAQIDTLTSERDALAGQMGALLDGAMFDGRCLGGAGDALIAQAQGLIDQAQSMEQTSGG